MIRRAQPTYHCPACDARLPGPLAFRVLGDIERTGQRRPYRDPSCGEVVDQVLVRWAT